MKKVLEFLKKIYKPLIIITCLIIFLAFVEDVFTEEIMQEDVIGYNFISKYLISSNLTPFIKFITNFGGAYILIIITVIIFVFCKNKKMGFSVFLNLVIITILNLLFKSILQRPRPTEYQIIKESGYSFPSGHSMISMAFYGYLIYLIYKNVKNKYLKWLSIIFLGILIILIGFSRIYLGVHYVSDVCAGFVFSIAYLFLFISIIKNYISTN